MGKTYISEYTLIVTEAYSFIRQTEKTTLFDAYMDLTQHCVSPSLFFARFKHSCSINSDLINVNDQLFSYLI